MVPSTRCPPARSAGLRFGIILVAASSAQEAGERVLRAEILRLLLRDATDWLDSQAKRVATHLADTTRGEDIGAKALETITERYTQQDLSHAATSKSPLGMWMTTGRRDSDGYFLDSNARPIPEAVLLPKVKQLTPDDWQLDREIALKAFASAPAEYKTTFKEALDFPDDEWRRTVQGYHAEFVALQDGKPIGMVAAAKHERPDTVLLKSMFVVPEARGSGVADRLVESVVDWAWDNGYRRVALWVREENLSAESVYLRHGFGWTGREEEGPRGLRIELHRLLGESTRIPYDSNGPRP
ncbi:GNAT family N-acetyltransferase [Nocardia sp. NPDC049149]|uniref:GNAT family N-acetyltransferase n=1 Tax=Nocardia sp. NPDC049149 TaxID=3364315 RepID=UPI00371D42BC